MPGMPQVLRVAVRERAARHQRGDHRDAGQLGQVHQFARWPRRGSRRRRRRAPACGPRRSAWRPRGSAGCAAWCWACSRAGPAAAARRRCTDPAGRPWGCRPAPRRDGRWRRCGTPRRSTAAMSSPSRTRKLCLVIGMVMPVMSASWKASVPMSARPTCPVMATTGMESIWASASGVTRLVAPGTRGGHHDADLAGGVGVAAGGVARALLVADQDVAQLLGVEQRVVDRQHRAAGDAEDDLDAELLQRAHHRLRAGELVGGDALGRRRARLGRVRVCAAASAPLAGAAADGSGARVVGCAHCCPRCPRVVSLGQEKTPVSVGGCTRVARWCEWLCPGRGKRGTNALANYYEHSAELHTGDGSLRTGQTSNLGPVVGSGMMLLCPPVSSLTRPRPRRRPW